MSLARELGRGADLHRLPLLVGVDLAALPELPPASLPGPEVLGLRLEQRMERRRRRQQGSYFTPPEVAAGLVSEVLAPLEAGGLPRGFRVVDPAVGGGAFLLAAADHLVRLVPGGDAGSVVSEHLVGVDRDRLAVDTAATALLLWAWARGGDPDRVVVIEDDGLAWLGGSGGSAPDVVIGNPPFLGQLQRETARASDERVQLADQLGSAVRPYADTAGLFLAAAIAAVPPGGRVCLVLPRSILAARDAAGVRDQVAGAARLDAVWFAEEQVGFDAAVAVWAPVLTVGVPASSGPVLGLAGPDVREVGPVPGASGQLEPGGTWSFLLAGSRGVPNVELDPGAGLLGELMVATAGFRDQYYGIADFLEEADELLPGPRRPRLLTVGLIDPVRSRWGERAATVLRRRWIRPVVDLDRLPPGSALGRWAEARLRPKLVLATQTRIPEAAVDLDGTMWPAVPTISVEAAPERLWEVAAVLHAPAVAAWVQHRAAGSGRGADSIRLRAAELATIPLPVDRAAWATAAAFCREAQEAGERGDDRAWRQALVAAGAASDAAYGVGEEVLGWWEARLPRAQAG